MYTKIVVSEDKTFDQLQRDIALGGKFVVFQYCISILFAVTIRKYSPAFFVEAGDDTVKLARKYNWITSICGWWRLPGGVATSLKSLAVNKSGGLDVTDDILINLTLENFEQREIPLEKAGLLFIQPQKDDLKAFQKSLGTHLNASYGITNLVIGLYVNTGEYEPVYIIGLDTKRSIEEAGEELLKLLRKQFRRHVPFEFVDLNDSDEFIETLKIQGLKLSEL